MARKSEAPPPSPSLVTTFASEDICPRCLGELDTGWECNDCGFDAMPLIRPKEPSHANLT